MNRQEPMSIKLISIEKIHILNPRVRNTKLFDNVVQNIAKVGLKRPITVMPSRSKVEGKEYDLVCGQGRLEAFMAWGQKMIPAIVINANEEQALIMSLVENVARRRHRSIDLLQGVEILRKQGYDAKTIAAKIGHSYEYVSSVITLLEHGEVRLLTAVEAGNMPITLAIDIVQSPKNEQISLQEAYETGQLSGHKFMTAKRILDDRRRNGKTLRNSRGKRSESSTPDSGRDIIKTYKREVSRKQLLERKADMVNNRLVFSKEAMRRLLKEEHFSTLLRAEALDSMPKQLAALISEKEF